MQFQFCMTVSLKLCFWTVTEVAIVQQSSFDSIFVKSFVGSLEAQQLTGSGKFG